MKNITKLMIDIYNLKNIDFMGYTFNTNNASYHHLIIPRRKGGEETIENGAVLNRNTSHPYLHIVESIDFERFLAITSAMIDENIMGKLGEKCIKRIDDILNGFEKEYCNLRTKKGKYLIKEEYIKERR